MTETPASVALHLVVVALHLVVVLSVAQSGWLVVVIVVKGDSKSSTTQCGAQYVMTALVATMPL
jgi:hypothetical protein